MTKLIAIATLLTATFAFAAEPKPDIKAAVLAAEQKWDDAIMRGDGAALENLMVPDIRYVHSSATNQSREEFIKAATSGSTKYTAIDFSDESVRQYGRTVILTHKAVFKNAKTGESRLFITEIWVEQDGGWKMASRQATKLP